MISPGPRYHDSPMALREEILYAFSKTPRPTDGDLTSCPCDECQWEVRRFRGQTWIRLTWEDLGEDGNVFFLTPEAFHYFLPGLMLLALDDPEDGSGLLGKIVSRIVISDRASEQDREGAGRILKRLSPRQRQLLIDLLRQSEDTAPHIPAIWGSAIRNLSGRNVSSYAQADIEQWLVAHGLKRPEPPPPFRSGKP
jgi:hypothetical protein